MSDLTSVQAERGSGPGAVARLAGRQAHRPAAAVLGRTWPR
jgi:hypothetical protein